ncbi:MAG: ATP-binding protein [Thermodesulfobacteriota bacterium]|nr:MAG: ATP-binding protein [Thermodesulfobacteriota bacterium]
MRPLRYFYGRPMGFKFTVVFLSVVLVPMFLLAYISYRVIDTRLMEHAVEQVSTGIKAAWTEYHVRGDQMRYGMLQAAAMREIQEAVASGDARYLRDSMASWKKARPYVDIWAVTDGEGRVIARLNSASAGDLFLLGGLTRQAVEGREARTSTELLDGAALRLEGPELAMNASPDASAPGGDSPGVLALMVVTPVLDGRGAVTGTIITGDVLNNDSFVPDMVSRKLPGFFTTISAMGVRVSTNITDENGRNMRGTRINGTAYSELAAGKSFLGEMAVGGLSLISLSEPIRDSRGNIVGSLQVGISKERLWAIQRENQLVIAVITLIGFSFALMAAFVSTHRITRPLKEVKEKLLAYGRGDQGVRIAVEDAEAVDEIAVLAKVFNRMADEADGREAEKARYLAEIEAKNTELAHLNEELRISNEELEIAYEETQSQTEELHAINEELKLLNEDLDRKNTELQKANRIILKEEEELKKAKNKLRLIYDGIRDFILLVGSDYKIVEANRSFLEMTGLTERAAVGRNVYAAFGLEPPARNCPVRKSIDHSSTAEMEFTTPDGKVFVWQSYPVLDGANPGSAVVYVHDVTEKRLLTQKLLQSDKLSSLGELVSGVAHELNNPLTGIMCFSELLLEDKLGESASSKIRKINEASHRCKKIIENLLTFARWKRPEKKYGDVNRIIRDSLDFRAYQLRIDNIKIDLDLDESIPGTMLDANQIQQVFLNLINNASDAIKEGGSGGTIRITSRHGNGKIVVSVEDSGKGISEEIANRIFDPFFTTKEVGKGTGLGLSISYGIVHEHGGNIYASSRRRNGTTFIVELPVAGDGSEGLFYSGGEASEKLKVDGKKALVVDDEPIVLDLLMDSLTGFGFVVDRCSSAEDAIVKVSGSDYDLIISDIKMPGLGGKGFYNEVQVLRPEALKKMIFISGDSINTETQAFLSRVGAPSIKKPFTIDELSSVVSKLVN